MENQLKTNKKKLYETSNYYTLCNCRDLFILQ